MPRITMNRLALSLLPFLLAACTEGTPVESPQNKAVIMDVSLWNSRQLHGEFTDPLYPIAIPIAPFDTMFTAVVRGWTSFSGPRLGIEPVQGELRFISARGVLLQHFHDIFLLDPQDFNKLRWLETGTYTAAHSASSPRLDSARVKIEFTCCTRPPSLGIALLPWKLTSDTSTITGTVAAEVESQVWVQAVATGFVEPVTYSWQLDGASLPGVTGTFYATSFSTPGSREFTVTMTGANSVQQVRSWSVFVTCAGGALVC